MTLGEVDPDPSPDTPPVPALADRAAACADRLAAADEVLVCSHIDADGLTSAAVASLALRRAGITFETAFFDQLDETAVAQVAATEYDTVLFTDFGSGQLTAVAEAERRGAFTPVIADHHQPADAETEFHLNPLLFGIDGAAELSGAGAAYVLARALEEAGDTPAATDGGTAVADAGAAGDTPDNRDLAKLAVVGAVGDMQDSGDGLAGANRRIVAEGVAAGVLSEETDLTIYGRQTRPLPKLLEYAGDVQIPGISDDQAGAVEFLQETGIDLKADGDWRRWADLDGEERQTVASALVRRAVSSGVPADRVESLIGTTYVLTDETPGTELRDVSEFSTLLNATARYDRADVGLAVCLGDRGAALERARTLLQQHRRNLSEGVDLIQTEGTERADNLQWFDAGTRIRETIVGIVAGMAVGSDGIPRSVPILAFAETEGGDLKVSARATGRLVARGLDLSTVMSEAAAAVDGEGGGHDVAAGATIPGDERETFLDRADEIVDRQLG
ncbi:DHH family phosphoesterase [Halobaculum sp. MBLA0143]|uniref:DHH family phosphoesterase n=1 Tax=Halobaculum sp. MBLA0143 TaxID=3079933 RepID=UPI003524D49A